MEAVKKEASLECKNMPYSHRLLIWNKDELMNPRESGISSGQQMNCRLAYLNSDVQQPSELFYKKTEMKINFNK